MGFGICYSRGGYLFESLKVLKYEEKKDLKYWLLYIFSMKKITLFALLLSYFYCLSAQDDSAKFLTVKDINRFKIYKTWISVFNDSKINGILYEVKDSSILVSNSIMKQDYINGNFDLSQINYNRIDIVKIRAKNSVGKGTLIGALTGFAVGGMLGILSGDDDPEEVYFASTAEQKAVGNAVVMSILGVGIGAIVGSIKVKIPIKGNMEDFNRSKNKLKKYTIR